MAVQIDSNRFGDHRRSYYSRTWEPLPVRYVKPPLTEAVPRESLSRTARRVGSAKA